MAYNPNMYSTYGQMYGNSYGQSMLPSAIQPAQPQSYAMQPAMKGEIEWVDGEVGAKAYQIPNGTTKPIALWDTNDTVIYLKSMNQYGIPNPIKKIHYQMEENISEPMSQASARLESGDSKLDMDMSRFVRKDELETMKEELKEAIRSIQNNDTKGAKSNGKSAV